MRIGDIRKDKKISVVVTEQYYRLFKEQDVSFTVFDKLGIGSIWIRTASLYYCICNIGNEYKNLSFDQAKKKIDQMDEQMALKILKEASNRQENASNKISQQTRPKKYF